MNIIARRNLAAFWTAHPEAEGPLRAWMSAADKLGSRSMNDVVGTFSKASPINAERCVFNIGGNNYRLIVAFRFDVNLCFITFIGSHADYDRIDAATVEQFWEGTMILPIRNDQDHERALDRARELWSAPGGSPEADELEVIGTLIDAYERRRWPVEMADPVDFLRFYLEQNGLRQKDLAAIIGGESRASEILNRRRRLTVDMIRAIARAWHIPADLLLGDSVPQLTASESA